LVDSERLAIRVEAEILTGLGWSLTESDVVERFVGRSAAYMHQEIERHLGRSIDWDSEFEARYVRCSRRSSSRCRGSSMHCAR
jgi:beta-phosphoglucomutase-like phosphatase (HAD superfamily)